MNSCLCMFEDGYTMVTSRNAVKLTTGNFVPLAALPKIEAAE
jgi:RNA:NAD 2'-phosphotransferase (TPT1/KptA family)